MFHRRRRPSPPRVVAFVVAAASLCGAALALPATRADALTTHDATVFTFGYARFHGSPGTAPKRPLAGIAAMPQGGGYWIARTDGGVYRYGVAGNYGSPVGQGLKLNSPVVGIAAHPSAKGYWLVNGMGHLFAYGAAKDHGSPYGHHLNAPIVAIAATPSGNGYWLLARDGGVFSYGDAKFHSSAFGLLGNGTAVSIASTASGNGYWVLSSNGGVLTFGDAQYYGSAFGRTPSPVVAMARSRVGHGYYVLDAGGRTFSYGDATNCGQATSGATFMRQAIAMSSFLAHSGCYLLFDNVPPNAVVAAPGTTGSVAVNLQGALLRRGYFLLPTGQYDTVTTQAVYAFQKANGRSRTGVMTAGDWIALAHSGRPTPRSTGSGFVAEVDKARQIVILERNGQTLWVINTSTGTEQPYVYGGVTYIAHTPTGHFTVSSQVDGLQNGRLGAMWRPKYFTSDGVAFHGSPSIPPYPASHGCVRMTNAAIDFIWAQNLIPLGTSVFVY
jgi:lipoprotein-anchoring transpeptidase ErfK/SrfK